MDGRVIMENSCAEGKNKDESVCFNVSEKSGIYAIVIDGKVLYVGQATNMSTRTSSHYNHIVNKQVRYKYVLLNEAIKAGKKIEFVELKICDRIELFKLEREYIKKYQYSGRKYPPLNFLFFKNEDNYSYDDFIRDLDVYTPLASSEPVSIKPDQIELVDKP